LDENAEYNFFKPGVRELNPAVRKDFSNESKSEVYIRQASQNINRCNICGGFLHKNSMQIDHVLEKMNGGIGNADNGQLTHPYCNSIKKNLKDSAFLKAETSFVA
jgi:hypothetical protein